MISSELRIGNYIFDDEGILSKINGFQPYGHSIRCDQNEGCELLIDLYPQDGTIKKGYEIDINTCKPIPLTEEWLLKFGFDLINNEYHQSRNHDLKLHWTVNKNKMIPEFNEKRFVTGYDFKYVHQLQNLYFALTGEELKINNYDNK